MPYVNIRITAGATEEQKALEQRREEITNG